MLVFASTNELATALHNASEAHHKYESDLGHPDGDWPTWYASFIADEQKFHKTIGTVDFPLQTIQPGDFSPLMSLWHPVDSDSFGYGADDGGKY